MRTIYSTDNPDDLTGFDKYLAYNGRDDCYTRELQDVLLAMHDKESTILYNLLMTLQAPACMLGMRGLRVDEDEALRLVEQLNNEVAEIQEIADDIVRKALGWNGINLQSDDQLQNAFYGPKNVPKCKLCNDTGQEHIGTYKTGKRKGQPKYRKCKAKHYRPGWELKPYLHHKEKRPTVEERAMAMLIKREGEDGDPGRLARCRLDAADKVKQRGSILAPRNPMGRYGFETRVGGPATLRFSSNKNPFDEGNNSQNVDKRLRSLFIADEGYDLYVRDFAKAESHTLAYLAEDDDYIEAHEGPYNTHVYVARLCFPELAWTGNPIKDREISNQYAPFGHRTYYDLAKIVQHGATRMGTAHFVNRTLRIGLGPSQEILDRFFGAFPVVRDYLNEFAAQVRNDPLVRVALTADTFRRKMLGRRNDPATAREAISHVLQSVVALICHISMWRIWNELDDKNLQPGQGNLELLLHGHDALMYQIKHGLGPKLDARAAELMSIPVKINGRVLTLKTDGSSGRTWKEAG